MFKLCFQHTGIAGVATVSSLTGAVAAVPCVPVCHNEVMEVVLNCWARGGYGLILHRMAATGEGQSRSPLVISYIEKGSPADKSGILQVGDRVLAVNDWCTSNGTVDEANYMLRHATGPLSLTVEFDVLDVSLPSVGVLTVKLAKRGQTLGVVIANAGSTSKGDPVVVSDVGTGSVAHRCGAIQAGDQILAIDSIPLDTCTVEEASRLLQRASDIVKLRIKKNSGGSHSDATGGGADAPTGLVYTVELSRKCGPLGLTIAGTDDRFDPIFISQLAPGGLADKTGAFRIGDRILAISGQSLHGKRVSEALQVLHQSGDVVRLKIARSFGDHSSSRPVASLHNGLPSTSYGTPFLSTVHEHFNERGTVDKLGTPVQSIDSAVESLEDAPLTDGQQPSNTASNRTSSNSKSSSLSGAPHTDFGAHGLSAEELATQLQRTLNAIKGPSGAGGASQGSRQSDTGSSNVSNAATDEEHYTQLGIISGELCPCVGQLNAGQLQEEWIRILECLESVSEAEMLRKLEEVVSTGSGPQAGPSSSNVTPDSTLPPKPPPKPFTLANPLLKQQYPVSSRLVSTSYLSMAQEARPITTVANTTSGGSARDPVAVAASILTLPLASAGNSTFSPAVSSSVAPSAIRAVPKPLTVSTILSGYEHIPLITTPVPSRASSDAPPVTAPPHSSDRPMSPQPGTSAPTANRHPLEVIRVTLSKDKVYNDFGFSVSDGVHDKGVYINKIRTAGPADLSGYIKPLDRIMQVNGINLKDLDCVLAVPLLAAAGDAIDLVLCRDPVVSATWRSITDSIEENEEDMPPQTTV